VTPPAIGSGRVVWESYWVWQGRSSFPLALIGSGRVVWESYWVASSAASEISPVFAAPLLRAFGLLGAGSLVGSRCVLSFRGGLVSLVG
jgi:protein involved in ribonucleotide reduction